LAVAAALCASAASFAQFSMPSMKGNSGSAPASSAPASGDVYASQDQLVKTYVAAASESLTGQSKMAEAVGLKDKAAEASARADAFKTGATVTSDDLKNATKVQTDVGDAIEKAIKEKLVLSEESKAKFGEGLGHLGLGLLGTVKLKEAATSFQQSAQAQINSASMLDKMSVTKKLGAGMYVATNLPGHISNEGSGLKSAVSYAQSHGIPVPADATAALNP
jgi:hypothetical protein